MKSILPELHIGDLIAKVPIIQGGMGVGVSLSGLASAVANQGGIGVISAVGIGALNFNNNENYKDTNIKLLIEEIRKAKSQSKGIIGLNVMVALSNYNEILLTAFKEQIDIVFLGAGLPLKLPDTLTPEYLNKSKTKVGMIVSSARAAKLLVQHWADKFNKIPDVIVVEGPKAGGHLGFKLEQIFNPAFSLENLVVEVKSTINDLEKKYQKKIPLIAGGGIFTGADIKKFIKLGADGVQMGTRFVATNECDAHIDFKKMYINAKEEDIVIIKSPLGLPGRAVKNQFLTDVSNGIEKPFTCPWKCLKTCDFEHSHYCIAKALLNAQKGNLNDGFAFAGENAYKINKIISVKELIDELALEYQNS
ncbi:MAG: nitronate monooxygenase [Candidatus Cloacimonetes bacterium]|nr:nitronate monooxygenase [Candidatus Cloacimonadota bacterium]MDD4155554.1 nitronate monooxygenase [Candidatus Cloacimonadota bacterium]